MIPSNTPAIDCIRLCCLRTVRDQITRIHTMITGSAKQPKTKNSAVPGPPIPAPWTETLDF